MEEDREMKTKLMRMLATLLAAVTLLGILAGCSTSEPATTNPHSSIGSTENPTTHGTEPTTGSIDDTTETTENDPAGDETISGTENTEPTTEPTTEPATEPATEPSTSPTDETEECAHQWSHWTVKKEATCQVDGSKSRSCANCGKTDKETLKATGHKYGSWSTTKAATCGAAGSKERKCSACGKTETQSIAALSHNYGSWSTTKTAACDTSGAKTRKCSDCGKTESQSIDATGHVWDSGNVTTQSTSCSAMGIKTYTCTKCSKTKTEQIKGNHTFGDWKWEEYTFKHSSGGTYTSHRKYRTCTKCGYKETSGSDHICQKGSDNHKVTTVKEGTCSTKAKMRSTCKICGWYVEYDGRKGECNWVDKEVHLSDYGTYTNELDATVSECKSCGERAVAYTQGKGWSDYNRYRIALNISVGNAYAGAPTNDNFDYLDHPTWQMVQRDFKYDSDGYVKQYTQYWWYNGSRHSQVIKCGKGEIESWFAEYGLTGGDGCRYSLKVSGTKIVPYKISWTG